MKEAECKSFPATMSPRQYILVFGVCYHPGNTKTAMDMKVIIIPFCPSDFISVSPLFTYRGGGWSSRSISAGGRGCVSQHTSLPQLGPGSGETLPCHQFQGYLSQEGNCSSLEGTQPGCLIENDDPAGLLHVF